MADAEPEFPVTIARSRYGGVYEPGEWVAFPCAPENVSPDWNAGDLACAAFYESHRGEVGGGASPQAAYADLQRLMAARSDRSHHP